MTTIPLPLLELFVALAETQSFSQAAAQLGVSKGTVSRSLVRLEAAYGAELVYRTTRSVTLTTAGLALYDRVRPHLAALVHSLGSLPERQAAPSGELRITAPTDFAVEVLGEVAARFSARYPAIQLDLLVTNRKVDLVAEAVDIAIRVVGPRMSENQSLTARHLASAQGALFAAPTYLARRGQPRDLGDPEHDFVWMRQFPRTGLPRGRVPRIVADDFFFLREVLRAGGGIGPLPNFLARSSVASGELVRVLPQFRMPRGPRFALVYPSQRRRAPKIIAFRDFLLDALRLSPLP